MNKSAIVERKQNVHLVRVCPRFREGAGSCETPHCPYAHFSSDVLKRAIEQQKLYRKKSAKNPQLVVSSSSSADIVACEGEGKHCATTAEIVACEFKGEQRGSLTVVDSIIVDASNVTVSHDCVHALHTLSCADLNESPDMKRFVFGSFSHGSGSEIRNAWKGIAYKCHFAERMPGQKEHKFNIDALIAAQVVASMGSNKTMVVVSSDGADNDLDSLSIFGAVQLALSQGTNVRIVGYNVNKNYFELQEKYPKHLEIKIITSDQVKELARKLEVKQVARDLKVKPVVRECSLEGAMSRMSLGSARNVKLSVDLASCCSVQFAGSASLSSSFASAKSTVQVRSLKAKRPDTNSKSVVSKCSVNPEYLGKKHGTEPLSEDDRNGKHSCLYTEPVVEPTPEFVPTKPTKTAKQLQQERLARLKATNPRLYKALMELMKKD
jgi:hypothetical protein